LNYTDADIIDITTPRYTLCEIAMKSLLPNKSVEKPAPLKQERPRNKKMGLRNAIWRFQFVDIQK